MTLSPPRCSRLPGPCGPVAPARFPSVLHESPVFDTQDRIYCVSWCRRDKLTNQRYVDMATWREAFDHEAFHPRAVQGSAPPVSGPSLSGGSVPRGLFLPGSKGVDRPIRQGIDRGEKLAENIRLPVPDSVVRPACDPFARLLLCAPSVRWVARRSDRRSRVRQAAVSTREAGGGGACIAGGCAVRHEDGRFGQAAEHRAADHAGRGPVGGGDGRGRSVAGAVRARRRSPERCGDAMRWPPCGVVTLWCHSVAGGCPPRPAAGCRPRPDGLGVPRNRHCHPRLPRACSVERRTRFAGVWAVEEWRRTLGGKGLGR